jgi:hypothetical protein
MTLVVAGISDHVVWMVADTFVTGGPLNARAHEHHVKVLPSEDGNALIGFAGDQHHGVKAVETARKASSGQRIIDHLRSVAAEYPVEFAYGYRTDARPRLIKVTSRETVEVNALFLGHVEAFEQFQAIRHRTEIDPVPKAIQTFLLGTASKDKPPEALVQSTSAMLRLFFERPERDVGGAAIPYILGPDGAFLCDYAFAVSDPITDGLVHGDKVPHGTPSAGGFSLSVASLNRHQGIVAYWLQKPGGFIFLRDDSGFKVIEIDGSPSEFRKQARLKLGVDAHVFFSEKRNAGQPDGLTIMHDQNGKPVMVAARYGRDLEFAAIDTSTDFRTKPMSVDFGGDEELRCSVATAAVGNDGRSAMVRFTSDAISQETTYDAKQLDELIATLAALRSRLPDVVPLDPREGRSRETVVIDPAWRTEHPPHPSLDGLLLRLRHVGLGWVTFLLPHHEATALAEWLGKNARK